VLTEFLLPTVREEILAAVEGRAELTDREKAAQMKKLDGAIQKAEQEAREQAKAEALAAIEAEFGGVAA
jgi:hypothetical protein